MDEQPRAVPPDASAAPEAEAGQQEAGSAPAGAPANTPKKVTFRDIYADLLTPTNLSLVGVALLLGLVGLLGGWDRVGAKETELTSVAAGQELQAKPFTMTFRKAFSYRGVQGLPPVGEGRRGLFVTVDVVNTTKEPIDLLDFRLRSLFQLKDVQGLIYGGQAVSPEKAIPTLYRGTDVLPARQVQPGLTTRLVVLWEQQATESPPKTLTVVPNKYEFRVSRLTNLKEYLNPTPAAQVTLPVQEVPVSGAVK